MRPGSGSRSSPLGGYFAILVALGYAASVVLRWEKGDYSFVPEIILFGLMLAVVAIAMQYYGGGGLDH